MQEFNLPYVPFASLNTTQSMNQEEQNDRANQVYISMGSTDEHQQERGFEIGTLPALAFHNPLRRRHQSSSMKNVTVEETLWDLSRQKDEEGGGGGVCDDTDDKEQQEEVVSAKEAELRKLRAKSLRHSMEEFFRLAATESQSYRFQRGPKRNESGRNSSGTSTLDLSPYERLENFIEEEFPSKDQIPSRYELINIGLSEPNRNRYKPGDWVEVEGNDMIWRVDMITRVIKQAPDDWDWNAPQNEGKEPMWKFTYNAGEDRNIEEEDLRSPEEGLKMVFGSRPWVWQQWAILKVEEKLRFQEGHQDDFMEKDIQKLATGELRLILFYE